MLSKYIIDANISYDTHILTRFDIFPSITSFGSCIHTITDNRIYIWRTIPYISQDDAEDRIIISSKESLYILSCLYDSNIYNLFHNNLHNFLSEKIIGTYLKSHNILLMNQTNINIGLSPYMNVKYTSEFNSMCNNLLQIYNIKYS